MTTDAQVEAGESSAICVHDVVDVDELDRDVGTAVHYSAPDYASQSAERVRG